MNALSDSMILVTGATGWLGKNLVRALRPGSDIPHAPAAGLPIRCLVHPDEPADKLENNGIEVVRGDLRSPDACAALCAGARDATIFHTAGIIHPRRIADFHSVHVEGTKNLLGAAESAGVRRIVAVSSNSPCGCNPHPDHVFDEHSPYRPYMNYGRSKMLMELAIQEAQARARLETVVIRPPWFYGPNQPARQTLFFSMIRDGKAPVVGDGTNRRSMAYIENILQGLFLAAVSEKANGRTYWIADRRPYTMNEIIDTVERLLEQEFGVACAHRRLRLPWLAGEAATAADATMQALGLYHPKVHVLSEMNKTIACSIARAREELGYEPAIALEEGMRRSLREWLGSSSHLL